MYSTEAAPLNPNPKALGLFLRKLDIIFVDFQGPVPGFHLN